MLAPACKWHAYAWSQWLKARDLLGVSVPLRERYELEYEARVLRSMITAVSD